MATTNAMGQGANNSFNLEQWLEIAISNNIDEGRIYDYLSQPLAPNTVTRWLKRIQRIENAPKPDEVASADWNGKKNRIKGRAFESLIGSILKSVRFFRTWSNVSTTTNEIDLLVEIGIGAQVSPVIRQWGSHFLCECKLVNKSINATWVGKLNTVLELHHAEVALLVASQGPPRGKVKTQIHILTFLRPPRIIVCISLDDLKACENGSNFLRLISTRYLEVKTGATGLISQ